MFRLFFFAILTCSVSVPLLAIPGLSTLPSATPSVSESPAPSEKSIAEQLQDARQAIDEDQATLTRMQSSATADSLSAAELPATMQSELVAAADNVLRHSQQYAENLEALDRTQKNAEARQALAEPDNKPAIRLDDTEIVLVRDRFNAAQQALKSAKNEMKILVDSTQEAVRLLPQWDQSIRQFSQNPSVAESWKWELIKLRKRGAESLILSNVVRKKVLALRITSLEEEATFDQKLLQADATAIQPGQGKAALARLEKERADINRQLQEANKRDQTAQNLFNKVRENYLKIRSAGVENNAEIATARQQYDLAQAEAETAEGIIESGRGYLQILDAETAHWKYLAKLGDPISANEAQKGIDALRRQLELTRQWKPPLESEVRSKQITIEGIKRRIHELNPSEADSVFLTKKLKLLQEQSDVQQRLLWRVETLQWRLSDWLSQFQKIAPTPVLRTGLKEICAGISSTILGAINYEVFHFKETQMVAGTRVVLEERSVTVGRLVIALTLFLFGYFLLGKFARFFVRAAQVRFQIPAARIALLEKFVLYLMTVVLALFTLSWVQIPLTIFAYLGGAIAIGIGFGAQNLINNFISGIILLFEHQINVGDVVVVDGNIGEIMTLGNRCSRMKCGDGTEVLIPNSLLLEKNVINWTLSDPDHRYDFTFSIAYGSPVEKVTKLVNQALRETPNILTQPIPCVFFEQFGNDGLVFGVYFWVKLYKGLDARQIGSNLRTRIDQLFRNEGIQMPFAQRDIHLDAPTPLRVQIEGSLGKPPGRPTTSIS